MWVRGVPPWSGESEDVNRYLEAGGNGLAMRILPHALYGADDDRFDKTARAIFLNGICTHGHPRALLGALCYGYVAWEAFRHVGTLPYGRLLKRAVDNFTLWSSIPQRTGLVSIWMESADRLNTGTFDLRWKEIAAEFLALLEKAVAGINSGALSIDSEVLSTLGCFDKSRNGAGTVCAAAAVYLASKYAPDPQHGILEAAFAPGADTDTLASMTGGLLGIIAGTDWLLQSRDSLQDERYLGEIADRLCETERSATIDEEIVTALPHHRNAREAILRDLVDGSVGATVLLPDGRRARVQHLDTLKSASAISAQQWHLTADDGQTLYIKKVGRIPKNSGDEDRSVPNKRISGKRSVRISSKVQALKLSVEDLNKSRSFYGGLLGLRVTRESKNAVNFGGVITLVNSDYLRDIDVCHPGLCSFRSIVCIETKDIELCYRRVSEDTSTRVGSFSELAGRRMFRCLDPDKNVVEVFEAPPKKSTSGLVVNS
jgi:catechol 2,3-dioxygenase-like lactoylglutathione lyase family enzyme